LNEGQWDWHQTPRTVLITKRKDDERTSLALREIRHWMSEAYPGTRILVDPETLHPTEYPEYDTFIAPLADGNSVLSSSFSALAFS
jgi:hypothetical protein